MASSLPLHSSQRPPVAPQMAAAAAAPYSTPLSDTPFLSESSDSHHSTSLLLSSPPSRSASLLGSAPVFPINGDDGEHDLGRPDMFGTLQSCERHVFLCYKDPHSWPSHLEAAEFDRLPRLLAAALKSRKNDMPKKTRLTICEGRDGTDTSNGDVLIFPDMIRYRGLTHFDIDTFVEQVFINDREWLSGKPERLTGTHVFVCCHASRDSRCGACGPPLVQTFKHEILARDLENGMFVRPCSHIGGRKYAGNVIIYGSNGTCRAAGNRYGYVLPEDVPDLIEHVRKGEILDRLWRGQMCFTDGEQKEIDEGNRPALDSFDSTDKNERDRCSCSIVQEQVNGHANNEILDRCCKQVFKEEKYDKLQTSRTNIQKAFVQRRRFYTNNDGSRWFHLSSWLDTWEREDTIALASVIGAAASVAVAYQVCRKAFQN